MGTSSRNKSTAISRRPLGGGVNGGGISESYAARGSAPSRNGRMAATDQISIAG
jgi:hypothetical protein